MYRAVIVGIAMLMACVTISEARIAAFTLHCVGVPNGTTTAYARWMLVAANGTKYYLGPTCNSTVNGGNTTYVFPTIPDSVGPIRAILTNVYVSVDTTHQANMCNGPDSLNHFTEGDCMADPDTGSGEVQWMLSIGN